MLGIEEGIEFNPSKYLSARGADAAFPGQVLIQPQATTVSVGSGQVAITLPIKQIDATFSNVTRAYLVGSSNTIFRTNTDTPPTWSSVGSLSGATASDIILHAGIIGVAHGNAGFRRSTDGATWTADTNSARVFGYLGTNDSSNAPLVWRGASMNDLYSSTGLTGTWSSSYKVGDTQFNLQSIIGIEQVLLVGKEDGIYSIDADGQVVPFTPELRGIASSNFASVSRIASFNGDYYFATDYGIIQISGTDGSKRRIGLDQLASPDIPTTQVRALASDDRYLYALCDNSAAASNLNILRKSISGAWHVFFYGSGAAYGPAKHLAISSALGYPALFFSFDEGGGVIAMRAIRLSTFPNPTQDSNYRYDTTASLWIRLGRFGPFESNIIFDRCTILADNLTANITVTPYLANEGGAVTQFGSSAATSSPYTEIKPTTALEGRYFDAYAYLATNTSATSPVLRNISFKGWLQPGRRRMHSFIIAATGTYSTPQGDFILDDPTNTISNLETLRTTDGYVTVIDDQGRSFSGYVFEVQQMSVDMGGTDQTAVHTLKVSVVEQA